MADYAVMLYNSAIHPSWGHPVQEVMYGTIWSEHGDVLPTIRSAHYLHRYMPGGRKQTLLPVWALDFTFRESNTAYRVVTNSGPWKKRHIFTANLYPPNTPFWEDCGPGPYFNHSSYILFVGGEVLGLDRLVDPQLRYLHFLDEACVLGTLLQQIAEVGLHRGEEGFCQAQALFFQLLDALLCSTPIDRENRSTGGHAAIAADAGLITAVDAYLREHLHERVTIDMLATHCKVSVSTLAHTYRKGAGMSPIARLLRYRLDAAKMLLLKGLTLKEIAAMVGFSDHYYLSKAFKQCEGITPRQFVQTIQRRP